MKKVLIFICILLIFSCAKATKSCEPPEGWIINKTTVFLDLPDGVKAAMFLYPPEPGGKGVIVFNDEFRQILEMAPCFAVSNGFVGYSFVIESFVDKEGNFWLSPETQSYVVKYSR